MVEVLARSSNLSLLRDLLHLLEKFSLVLRLNWIRLCWKSIVNDCILILVVGKVILHSTFSLIFSLLLNFYATLHAIPTANIVLFRSHVHTSHRDCAHWL